MASTGILMHIRHLDAVEWGRLVWGVPAEDSVGSLPKVAELVLREAASEPVEVIVFGCGPSRKDGLSEGEYTKQYLLSHLAELKKFPRFKALKAADIAQLRARLKQIIVLSPPTRTIDEVVGATKIFADQNITKVLQVTAASHAPRCIQIQSAARSQGLIPSQQQWAVITDDRSYAGADPFSTLVMEPPHRGDDPMIGFRPSLPELLRGYQYDLSPAAKKKLAKLVKAFFKEHAKPSDVRELKGTDVVKPRR
jgi:hypothetical protein